MKVTKKKKMPQCRVVRCGDTNLMTDVDVDVVDVRRAMCDHPADEKPRVVVDLRDVVVESEAGEILATHTPENPLPYYVVTEDTYEHDLEPEVRVVVDSQKQDERWGMVVHHVEETAVHITLAHVFNAGWLMTAECELVLNDDGTVKVQPKTIRSTVPDADLHLFDFLWPGTCSNKCEVNVKTSFLHPCRARFDTLGLT